MKAELIAAYAIEHAFYLYHRVLLLFELEVIWGGEKKLIRFKYPQKQLNLFLLGAE